MVVRVAETRKRVRSLKLRQRHLHDPKASRCGGGVAGLLDEDALPLVVDARDGGAAGHRGEGSEAEGWGGKFHDGGD